MWIFKIKRDKQDAIKQYKARLVVKGCGQQYGVDYYETYAPTVRIEILLLVFALAVNLGLLIHQMDINTATN